MPRFARGPWLKVVQGPGQAWPADRLKEALNWLGSQDDVRLINLSLGSVTDCDQRQPSCPICDEVDRLVKELRKVVVVSSGNLGAAGVTCPAKAAEAIVVGSAGWADPHWASATSSYDKARKLPHLLAIGEDVAAPLARFALSRMTVDGAGHVRVELPAGLAANGVYVTGSGTSLAAAAVTGLLARLLQLRPALRADEARHWLCGTAKSLTLPAGKDNEAQGAGLIDAAALSTWLTTLRLTEVKVTPDQAAPGDQVDVTARVENATGDTIEAVRVAWALRGSGASLCGAEATAEFQLTSGSGSQPVSAKITLPGKDRLSPGDRLDLVCTCQGEVRWKDDPNNPQVSVVEGGERDQVVIPGALRIT